jgi:hypothetical protein
MSAEFLDQLDRLGEAYTKHLELYRTFIERLTALVATIKAFEDARCTGDRFEFRFLGKQYVIRFAAAMAPNAADQLCLVAAITCAFRLSESDPWQVKKTLYLDEQGSVRENLKEARHFANVRVKEEEKTHTAAVLKSLMGM